MFWASAIIYQKEKGDKMKIQLALIGAFILVASLSCAKKEDDKSGKEKMATVQPVKKEKKAVGSPMKVVDETLSGASNLYRGIPCPTNTTIMDLEMEGLRNLMDENKGEEDSIVLGGVVTGRIHSIPTVKELIDNITTEAAQIILELPKKVIK